MVASVVRMVANRDYTRVNLAHMVAYWDYTRVIPAQSLVMSG
jgi:hypothetical protein